MALLALAAAPQQPAAPQSTPQTLRVTVGTHLPFELSSAATRVAVGNPEVLSYELLDERELLLLGQTTGRTSLLIWDDSNRPQQFAVLVQPDLTLLAQALDDLAPGVIVESALDRDAVLLRGLVQDVRVYAAVESTARAWLDAGAAAAAPSNALPGVPLEDLPGAPQAAQSAGRVINLLTILEQPRTLEERITDAMDGAGYRDVRTARVLRGAYPDDSLDAFVLEGSVPDQAALTRALLLASATLDPALVSSGLEVLADESGALSQGNNQLGQQQNQQFAAQGQGGVFQGGGGQGNQVNNRIQQNLGRATAVSAAGGRVLSFLEVVDLP
ncbi:MAG: pilus assembly protein N-terminal domain-containing protein, partial [Planctomycetota bacterium]